MKLNVEAVLGMGSVRRRWIGPSQRVTVGGSDWADLAIAEDPSLSDIHFELVGDHREFIIRDLSRSGTWVNEDRVELTRVRDRDVVRAGGTCFRVAIDAPDVSTTTIASVVEELCPSGLYRSLFPGSRSNDVVHRFCDQNIQFVVERSQQRKVSAFGTVEQILESVMQFGPVVVSPSDPVATQGFCTSLAGQSYIGLVSERCGGNTVEFLRDRIGTFVSPEVLEQQLRNSSVDYARELIGGWQSIVIVEPNGECVMFSQDSCKTRLEDRTFGLA